MATKSVNSFALRRQGYAPPYFARRAALCPECYKLATRSSLIQPPLNRLQHVSSSSSCTTSMRLGLHSLSDYPFMRSLLCTSKPATMPYHRSGTCRYRCDANCCLPALEHALPSLLFRYSVVCDRRLPPVSIYNIILTVIWKRELVLHAFVPNHGGHTCRPGCEIDVQLSLQSSLLHSSGCATQSHTDLTQAAPRAASTGWVHTTCVCYLSTAENPISGRDICINFFRRRSRSSCALRRGCERMLRRVVGPWKFVICNGG